MSLAKRLSSIALPHRESIDFERFDYTVATPRRTLANPEETKESDGFKYVDRNYTYSGPITRIGSGGFHWPTKSYHWVGIDVDAIDGHSSGVGISNEILREAREAAAALPWVDVRLSTGGKGLHFFIYFAEPIPVERRSDSTKIARAVIDVMSREIGFDFRPTTDKLGGNIWMYAADGAENAYEIVSPAAVQFDPKRLPPGWREAGDDKVASQFYSGEEVVLSEWHKQFEKHYCEDPRYELTWLPDIKCWRLHTHRLNEVMESGRYRGIFRSRTKGCDPSKANGFGFPCDDDCVMVHRYGTPDEDPTWIRSRNGKVYSYFNKRADIQVALNTFSENRTKTNGDVFTPDNFKTWLEVMEFEPLPTFDRQVHVKCQKGTAQIWMERRDDDPHLEGWTKTNGKWEASREIQEDQKSTDYERGRRLYRSRLRAVTVGKDSTKWVFKPNGSNSWSNTNSENAGNILAALGVHDVGKTKGQMRMDALRVVWKPLEPEWLPNNEWNPEAPQLRYKAQQMDDISMWLQIFTHMGKGLDEAVALDPWCQQYGVRTGGDYLMLLAKLSTERPQQRLPYMYFYSRQNNTGKTTFGEVFGSLFTCGHKLISREAITSNFNSELKDCLVGVIEEVNLFDKNGQGYEVLKQITTSPTLSIRLMQTDRFEVPNYIRFFHFATALSEN